MTEQTTPATLDPADKEAVEWAKQERQQQAYKAEFERVKGLDDYKDIPDEDWALFHPFVASADGDFDRAAQGFNQWRTQAQERYAPPPAEGDPPPPPPAALGSDAATPPAPPIEKNYTGPNGLENALDDFFAETRPGAPPVVGSV